MKERNLKNEITKYKIDIKVEVEFYELIKTYPKNLMSMEVEITM